MADNNVFRYARGAGVSARIHHFLFVPAGPRSKKKRCRVCGKTGWANDPNPRYPHWMASCMQGHKPCPKCGKMMAVQRSGAARIHSRCTALPAPPASKGIGPPL